MIEWKKYNWNENDLVKGNQYLVYSQSGAEVASFSSYGTWMIWSNEVLGVTHYAELNTPKESEEK